MVDNQRRKFIRSSLLGGSALALGSLAPQVWASRQSTFRIGFISPQSGPLQAFAATDEFVTGQFLKAVSGGVRSLGKHFNVELIVRDSQSSPRKAAAAARELIEQHQIDLMLTNSTPATTVPVANVCEALGVPCISNDTPWQAYFLGRNGDYRQGFKYTWHFCWGVEDVIDTYTRLWQLLPGGETRRIGALWPNDEDGRAWGDPLQGFPSALDRHGFEIVDHGRFESPKDDFHQTIRDFTKQQVDIVTGVISPVEFANFWQQSRRIGFQPEVVTVAKATEFPQAVHALGDRAEGLSVEMMWSPSFPFTSSMTAQNAAELATAYEAYSGQRWDVTLGMKHSLFEVAYNVIRRAGSRNPRNILRAIKSINVGTVLGNINFQRSHIPNLAKTPLVAGQWQRRGSNLELVVVENSGAINVPIESELQPIRYG